MQNFDFEHILDLCKLTLSEVEALQIKNYIKTIDVWYQELLTICDENVEPLFYIHSEDLVFVEDVVLSPLALNKVLENALYKNSNYIIVKSISNE